MNIRLTSLFVSLFLSVPVWAGGHKNLPAKGDLHIPVFENVNVRFSPDTCVKIRTAFAGVAIVRAISLNTSTLLALFIMVM